MLKKWCCCMFAFLCLFGCDKMGSFEKGNLNVEKVIYNINKQITDKTLEMELLNEIPWEDTKIEEEYGFVVAHAKEAYVFSSVVKPQLGEIAFFQADDTVLDEVKNAISYRKENILNTWKNTIPGLEKRINASWEGKIGQYYCFVLGTDTEKVVNYLRSLK